MQETFPGAYLFVNDTFYYDLRNSNARDIHSRVLHALKMECELPLSDVLRARTMVSVWYTMQLTKNEFL